MRKFGSIFSRGSVVPIKLRYSLILFDADGVLFDSNRTAESAIHRTFQYFDYKPHIKVSATDLLGAGHSPKDSLCILNPELKNNSDLAKEWFRVAIGYYREYNINTLLYPGVEGVLNTLKGLSVKMVIVSTQLDSILNDSLEIHQLGGYFSHSFGDCDDGILKPNLDVFSKKIAPLYPSIPREQILMVGDTVKDAEFAKKCGFDFCWANYGYGNLNTLTDPPVYTIDHIGELSSLIKVANTGYTAPEDDDPSCKAHL